MENTYESSSEIEIVLDLKAAANLNSNRIERNPKYDFKTIEPKEEPNPIIMSNYVGIPHYINIDDDSDEEITCLGTFTSSTKLPENSQPSNVKEEIITSKPEQDINHCKEGSDVEETSKIQHIIPGGEEFQDSVKKTLMTKPTVNPTLPAIEKISSSKSQYNIRESTSSSVILSGTNRANQTSHDDPGSIPSEKSLNNDCLNGDRANKPLLDGQKKQTNASLLNPVMFSAKDKTENPEMGSKSNVISNKLHTNICPPEVKSTNVNQIVSNLCSSQDNNSSPTHEVINTSLLLQKNTSSSVVTFSSPISSNRASGVLNDHHKDNDSTATVQNHRLSPGSQQIFGSNLKQQVRYVTLPAKFLGGKVTKQITGSMTTGRKIVKLVSVNKQPINMNGVKGELPYKVDDKTQKSAGSMVQVSDVSGLSKAATAHSVPVVRNPAVTSQKIVMIQNNPNVITKSNSVTNNTKTVHHAPPSMLLFNNQVIKLKGIKQQGSLLKDTSVHSSDGPRKNEPPVSNFSKCGVDQSCQTDNSTKSFVDQSCQTNIYSWMYKNSKLYTFIDDEGKQVEIVPVETVKVAKPPVETDVASPVSSLDNESDMGLEDEISVTDEPIVNNFERHHSSDNALLQTGQTLAHISEIEPSTPQNIPCNYQPQNTFQEVLYTDLGLYNPTPHSVGIQTNSFGYQNNVFQNNTYQQENTNINTVYNHELQMYVPSSQKPVSEPVFEQAAVANPDVQYSTPNTNPVVDIFTKLIEDIRTCLSIDSLGNIPLHQAVIDNNLVKLKSQCVVLKSIGSNLDHLNLAHETALILAVKVAVDTCDYEAVSILVSEGADQRTADMEGNTPLHYSVRRGCEQLVRVLLTADDADKVTEKFNHDGLTPLHIAALEGYDEIIKLLVGTTIDINVKDRKNGRTPYFLAVKEKKWTSAKLLKMFGADVNEPNFADQIPFVMASPEKSLPQLQGSEENVDDPGNLPPTLTEINMPLVKENMPDPSHFPKLFGTREQRRDNWESQFVYVGRNEIGLSPLTQVISRNEVESNKERVKIASEEFDAKELYDKYVKIAAKRKSDSQVEELVTKPKMVSVKMSNLKPPAQSKTIDKNFQNKNVAVSSSNVKSRSCESDGCKNDSQSQSEFAEAEASISESQYQHTINCKAVHSDIKCQRVHQININNDSVLYNKAVLTSSNIVQGHQLNSNVGRQNNGNETKPNESEVASKENRLAKLTCETVQDERSRDMQLNVIENSKILEFTSEKNDKVYDINLEPGLVLEKLFEIPTHEHSALKNSCRDHKGNCQSPSEASTDINLISCLELYTDNPINENESFVEETQPVHSIVNFSKAHLSENDQNILLNLESEITLGDKSNLLLRTPHLLIESQEMSQSSCEVIHPNSKNNNSIKANHSVNPIGYSSLNYIHTPSSAVPKKVLGDTSNELLHLPKEIHEKCQSSGMHQVFNSVKTNSDEPKQPINLFCNSSSNQGPDITSRKRSSQMLKEKQINSLSSSEHLNSNGGKTNSFKANKIISSCSTSEDHRNCPSIPLHTVTSKVVPSEMLEKSQCKKAIEGYRDFNTKLNEESPPPQDFNFEKQFVEKVADYEVQENKTNCDSGDDNSCFEETSCNIDFGIAKDVIIGNDSSKSNIDITHIKSNCNLLSKADTECVQLSFDALLDDIVNKKKESISSQKPNPKQSKYRKRKLDEPDVLMNSQKADLKKIQIADLPDVAPTATDTVNSLISYSPKIVSGSNKKNNINSSKIYPQSSTESTELKADNLLNTNLTKVNCSEDVQNLNPEEKGELGKSLLDDSESNKKFIPNSSSELVTNMRNKLVSLVSCKVLLPKKVSNNVALRESVTPSVSIKSENIQGKAVRRSSKSLSTDSESNFTEQIHSLITPTVPKLSNAQPQANRITSRIRSLDSVEQIHSLKTLTVPKLSNAQSQANRTISRKRSLDSVEPQSQETQKKRISNNNSEVTKREDVQLVVSNTLSRKSTRISKKKVEFDL